MMSPKTGQPRHAALILLTTILASSLSFIDGSVVNVGLPAIGASFAAGAADLQWIINAYLLPLGALLLLGGAAGDRFGRQRLLVVGTALFAVASLACALAPSLFWLLAGRAAQGVGAAILLPNSLAILGSTFSGEAKGRSVGIWAAAGAVMGALGPVLGGWLIDTIGWRSIFLINLPPALGAIGLALVYIRDTACGPQTSALDVPGGLLATGSLGAMTWGLTIGTGPAGWTMAAIMTTVAGAILAGAFLYVEKARGNSAMMPLALFGSRTFAGLTLLTLLLYGALGALMVLVPYVLITAAGYSGTGAGAALLPFAALLAVASPVMGSVAEKTGPRLPLTIGPLLVAAGFALLLRIDEQAGYWTDVFPGILVLAIGMAGAVAPLTTAVLSSVDDAHTGSASGLNSAVARTAGMIATALLGGVLGASGHDLIAGFRVAMSLCAGACILASASAFCLVSTRMANRME
ncbi:MFS transporter [Asticcacaulis taihuensis]|uniref:Drug resistance transporter, EmrB/QacA subfamily n=1 Tax=Asticcacaulis taihuensis TaxID=260084 RepID=A0A1G4R800_9CAUL|nr:MFS transporter [Asticcacaulis taihuensis]SCW52930.1 drug resistance transporter, EmrB/QacA subfamily [Asticcacaulis taihuensis]